MLCWTWQNPAPTILQATLTSTSDTLKAKEAKAVRLQAQLDQAQTQLATLNQQHQAQQERHTSEFQQQAERLDKAQSEKEQAQQATSASREEAAKLRGELEALRVQNATLLATLAPAAPAKDSKGKSKPA